MYASATFCFFSGTGNSARAALWADGEARARGIASRVLSVDAVRPGDISPGPGKLLGIFLPTHAFIAPWLLIRFVSRLPRGRGTDVFVMPTRGGTRLGPLCIPGMEGTAGWLPALILVLRGYRLRGVTGLDMPANWTAFHWGMRPESIGMITARAEPRARRFAGDILDGKSRIGGFIPLGIGLVLLPLSAAYLLLGRFFLAKLFFADNRCTGCGGCARACPSGAIRMQSAKHQRPSWTFACESCMRCMAFCPEKAIQAGHSWAALLVFLTVFSGVFALPGYIFPGISPRSWPGILLGYALIIAALGIAYSVFTALLRIPAVNALFAWTTFTRFWRRYHEPEVTLERLTGEE